MRGIRKDGRGHAPDLVIRQGVIGTQRRGMGSKTGCELHGLSPDEKGLLFKPHTGFLDSEPSLSAVRCGRHEEPGWPCCHRLSLYGSIYKRELGMVVGLKVLFVNQSPWATRKSCPWRLPGRSGCCGDRVRPGFLVHGCFGRGVQPVLSKSWRSPSQARNSAIGVRSLPLFVSPNSCRKASLRMYKEGQ